MTLIYSAWDEKHNNAVVLMDLLNKTRVVESTVSRIHG
jgi:predicted RNA-binding protein